MSYVVDYYTLAKLPNGKVGNVKQNLNVLQLFTDAAIENIPSTLNKYLESKKLVGVIIRIEFRQGICL